MAVDDPDPSVARLSTAMILTMQAENNLFTTKKDFKYPHHLIVRKL